MINDENATEFYEEGRRIKLVLCDFEEVNNGGIDKNKAPF